MEGTPFGRYRLIELLGRGGMGEVWRAQDTAVSNRTVAIKLLPPQLASDAKFVARFQREADAAARLNNPHIIPIHGHGEIDGQLYVDMRLVEGHDLEEVLADGALPPERAVRIIEQVAKALHAAHKIGLVHRDVKPSNILLDEDDFAYLIDFGIARGADQTGLTGTGAVIGSWHYMAPERLRADQVDARADIYALTCVLYECLTGSPPFPGQTMESQVVAHLTDPPPQPSISRPQLPRQIDEVIATGMAKDADRRYATTVELATAAHDAITTPIPRPATAPPLPPTVQVPPAASEAPTHVMADAQAGGVSPSTPTQHRPATPRPAPGPRRWQPRNAAIAATLLLALVAVGITGYLAMRPAPPGTAPSGVASPPPSATVYGLQITMPFTGLNMPTHLAVVRAGLLHTAGTVYVVDNANKRVVALAAGSSTQAPVPFTGLTFPLGVAADNAGAVYVVDDNRVLKLPAGSGTPAVLPFTGLKHPVGVAVDSTGTVYVADTDSKRVVALAAGSSTQKVVPFDGLNDPGGVAVDNAGAVYLADGSRIVKLPAGSGTQSVLPFTGLDAASDLAVDSAGAVYVSDFGNNRVVKLAAGSSSQSVLPLGALGHPGGVGVDTAGDVYVTDISNHRVVRLPVA